MFHVHNKSSRKIFILAIVSAMVLLAYFGSQTMSMQSKSKTYQESSSVAETTSTTIPVETTTSTTLVEVTTTIPEIITTTTTRAVIRTTTTEPYISTTIQVEISGGDGPPRNTTSLVGCIAFYESTWGEDPNVFQFQLGTWQTYGGTGIPSNAPYWRQEQVFWLAWEDAGKHHWAAQKGRCF